MALVVLLYGAASASADDSSEEEALYCSNGFDAPATLGFAEEAMVLTIGDKVERFYFGGGTVGTGLNGSTYYPEDKTRRPERLMHTRISLDERKPDTNISNRP
jgi:hypothetical protein